MGIFRHKRPRKAQSASLETADTNLSKADEFLDEIRSTRLTSKSSNRIAAAAANAMYQGATAFLIAETGDAPYKVSECVVAFTKLIAKDFKTQTGYSEDILFAYSLRTVAVYDVVYRANINNAKIIAEKAKAFVKFCSAHIDSKR